MGPRSGATLTHGARRPERRRFFDTLKVLSHQQHVLLYSYLDLYNETRRTGKKPLGFRQLASDEPHDELARYDLQGGLFEL